MSTPVTWLLPVKNGMPFLPETLASIEAQTYKNWEILAWDNGSTDGTIEELQRWIPARLPGRVVTDRPLGLGMSLAELVKNADTEFCARIDADDINLPERLEQQVAFLDSQPQFALVGAQCVGIDEHGSSYEMHRVPTRHDDIVHCMMRDNPVLHPTVLFRRSCVLQVGNYRDIKPVEDYDLWFRLAMQYKLAALDAPLLQYRVHSNSTTHLATAQNRLHEASCECFMRYASSLYGLSEREARLLREKRYALSGRLFYRIARHLQRIQGGTVLGRLRSDSFIDAAWSFTANADRLSRLLLTVLDRRRSVLSFAKARLTAGTKTQQLSPQ